MASTMRLMRCRMASNRRAEAHSREVIDRAAEVDVDEIRAARFDQRRGPADFVGLVAGELHAETRLVANRRINANSLLRRCFSRRARTISLT